MTPGQALVRGEELDDTYRLAKGLALSGMFPDARSAEQALAKILIGRDLGLSPTQAMMGIHIVEGKPMVAAVTLGAFVRQSEHYDYAVIHLDDEKCTLEFSYDTQVIGVSEFSMVDAKRAGLVKDKSGWIKYPRNMLFARAMSNGIRWYCPDATQGVAVYHEGEVIPEVARDGLPAGETIPEVEVDTSWIDNELDAEVAFDLIAEAKRGDVSMAVVEMNVRGQSVERVQQYIETLRSENDLRDNPPDADVVDPEEPNLTL